MRSAGKEFPLRQLWETEWFLGYVCEARKRHLRLLEKYEAVTVYFVSPFYFTYFFAQKRGKQ